MDFFQTLMRPDREEDPERAEIVRAANILQVGEFQFLQLAYRAWHGREMPERMMNRLFSSYMLRNEVPHWAQHYAREILRRDAANLLQPNDPLYHCYDVDYRGPVSDGLRRFCLAASLVAMVLACSVLAGHFAVDEGTSVLPPYFEKQDIAAQPVFPPRL